MKIITISGMAQHGKDTTASILKEHFEQQGKRVLVTHYADYLKYVCEKYFGWNGLKDAQGRNTLQIYGTEKARDNYMDVWVDVVIAFLKAFGQDYDYVLIPDTRYHNEVEKLKKEGFDVFTCCVFRERFDNGLTFEQKNHRSETSMLDYPFDYLVSSQDSMISLVDKVRLMINECGLDK